MKKTYIITSTTSKVKHDRKVLVELEEREVKDYILANYDIDYVYGSKKKFLSAEEVKVAKKVGGQVKTFAVIGGDYYYCKSVTLFEHKLVKSKITWEDDWVQTWDIGSVGKDGIVLKNGRCTMSDENLVENFL